MILVNFTAMIEKGLNKKVNAFLKEHPYIEIVKFEYAMGQGGTGVEILYQDDSSLQYK